MITLHNYHYTTLLGLAGTADFFVGVSEVHP